MNEQDGTASAQVTRSKVTTSNGKMMTRVAKSSQFDSNQVNRTLKTSSSQSSLQRSEPAIVSWSTQLRSVNQSESNLTLHLRANKEVTENVIVTWSTELATQWSGYESLKGTVTILKGNDSGYLVIDRIGTK